MNLLRLFTICDKKFLKASTQVIDLITGRWSAQGTFPTLHPQNYIPTEGFALARKDLPRGGSFLFLMSGIWDTMYDIIVL